MMKINEQVESIFQNIDKSHSSFVNVNLMPYLNNKSEADAIKKFTPSLGIPYLGV